MAMKLDILENEYMSKFQHQKRMMYLHQQISEFEKLDIEHKRTKSATWPETEEKYRHQLEQTKQYACIVQDGKIRLVTSNIAKLLGYNHEELIGNLFIHFAENGELPKLIKRYIQRMSGEDVPHVYKTVLKHKDGSKVYVEINAGLIPYQGRLADFAILRCLTKRT
jgi:PAS domain S-box-containing protein